jgi:hypothetical protein
MPLFSVRIHFERHQPKQGYPSHGWCDYDTEAATPEAALKSRSSIFERDWGHSIKITGTSIPGQATSAPLKPSTPDLFDR